MRGPARIFWADLTPFSLAAAAGRLARPDPAEGGYERERRLRMEANQVPFPSLMQYSPIVRRAVWRVARETILNMVRSSGQAELARLGLGLGAMSGALRGGAPAEQPAGGWSSRPASEEPAGAGVGPAQHDCGVDVVLISGNGWPTFRPGP